MSRDLSKFVACHGIVNTDCTIFLSDAVELVSEPICKRGDTDLAAFVMRYNRFCHDTAAMIFNFNSLGRMSASGSHTLHTVSRSS